MDEVVCVETTLMMWTNDGILMTQILRQTNNSINMVNLLDHQCSVLQPWLSFTAPSAAASSSAGSKGM
jgi:hypothetical protein